MSVMKPALPAAILLVAAFSLGADRPVPRKAVIPPCTIPRQIDVREWRTVWIDRPRVFRLPPGFEPDPTVRYEHGGRRWKSSKRLFEMVSGIWGQESFGGAGSSWYPGYSECTDTLAGTPFRLITTYSANFESYMAIAVPVAPPEGALGFSLAFIGQSPDSADQPLFLAIFRTLRADTIGAAK
jgi:hypothetical protein